DALAEHNINDIDALAQTSVDDLVEFLDLSLDEAETILNAAKAVVAMRDRSLHGGSESEEVIVEEEPAEQHAVSAEFDESIEAGEVEPSDNSTAEGYDDAVETGTPFSAEPEILAEYSADPVALTEIEPLSEADLILQETGRDLRPDTITPAPDITSTGAAAVEYVNEISENGLSLEEIASSEDVDTEAAAAEAAGSAKISAPESTEDAASGGGNDEEKQDASPDAVK
ncbi:MAG: hypothetical protein M3O61_19445, partial [Gemmatimonadota bacterium]|nr:hypothetical protein [Gemmatimonadota bacterium]